MDERVNAEVRHECPGQLESVYEVRISKDNWVVARGSDRFETRWICGDSALEENKCPFCRMILPALQWPANPDVDNAQCPQGGPHEWRRIVPASEFQAAYLSAVRRCSKCKTTERWRQTEPVTPDTAPQLGQWETT